MKNVLLLSDFSSYAINATSYAMQLFKGRSVNFYILNVVKVWNYTTDDLMSASGGEVLYNSLIKSSKVQLEKKVEFLRKKYTDEDFTFTSLIDYDVFTDAINQAITTYEIELIIMGSNGQSDFVERIFGSHSTRVLRNVSCPIFVIPDTYEYTPAKQLLMVFGEGKQYTTSIFDMVFKLFFSEPINPSVLRFAERDPVNLKEELEMIEHDFKQSEVPYFRLTDNTTSEGEQLHIVNQAINADINVVSVKPSSFWTRLFKQSAIASMIGTVKKPTLFLEG